MILVSGATGYVGGRLTPRLLEAGYPVRVLARDPRRLQGRSWLDRVQVVQADVGQADTLPAALAGVQVAYYLIHSIAYRTDFPEQDLLGARNFSLAAKAAGVTRIIYLGELGDPQQPLSEHQRSRQQVGATLREAGIPVTEFRAGVIVGSGSISFEIIRNLSERLPVMLCPRWLYTRIQPIGIADVLRYLIGALDAPESSGKIIEIGGQEVLTYCAMMDGYAKERDLNRIFVPAPVFAPRLSVAWVHWVTPIPAAIARPLIDGLRNDVVLHSDLAAQLFPDIHPIDYRTALQRALNRLDENNVETIWSDSLTSSQGDIQPLYLSQEEGLIRERRTCYVNAPASSVFEAFCGLGGKRGWLALNSAWRLRGAIDRLFGGVGMRRGRRHPDEVRVGEAIDFWRVEAVEPDRLLRLRAEMKVPGLAWLQFESIPIYSEQTLLIQTAFFDPKGVLGQAYWYLLYPLHAYIFAGMVRKIAEAAAQNGEAGLRDG